MNVDLKYDREKLLAGLDDNIWNFYSVPENARIFKTSPRNFFSANRLDIIARYILIRQMELGWGIGWALEHYRDFLFASNPNFIDGDGQKSSLTDYMSNFINLIQAAQNNNFDFGRVVIPFVDDTIVDGAHRFSIALYYNLPVYFVEVEGPSQKMNWHGLRELGIRTAATEQLLQEYLHLNDNTYCAVFFGQPEKKLQKAREVILDTCDLIYEKTLLLSEVGCQNLMVLLYGHEPWWKNNKATEFVELRLPKSCKATVIFFSPKNKQGSRPIKELVRSHFPAEHCVHANDTHQETKWLADIFLSTGGIKYLNNAPLIKTKRFNDLFNAYVNALEIRSDKDEFAIDSGAVLAAHGIRDCNDLDYISARKQIIEIDQNLDLDIANHNDEYSEKLNFLDMLIANPDFHFRWKGTKFLSLDTILFLKINRGAPKDIKDAQKIIALRPRLTWQEMIDTFKLKVITWKQNTLPIHISIFLKKLREILPNRLYLLLRFFWQSYKNRNN